MEIPLKLLENRVIELGNEQSRLNSCIDLVLIENQPSKTNKQFDMRLSTLSNRAQTLESGFSNMLDAITIQENIYQWLNK